ncbi:MAG: hypothetical protein WCP55_11895, partial [Lentisphaerota bacterium]
HESLARAGSNCDVDAELWVTHRRFSREINNQDKLTFNGTQMHLGNIMGCGSQWSRNAKFWGQFSCN